MSSLGFTYSEHFSAAGWARTLRSWASVLHSYRLSIAHFSLRSALNTVTLHGKNLPDITLKCHKFTLFLQDSQ